ncbi:MAG: thiamine pyrophosphate-dependent enzyme, partial [Actinomycetota bacterium]
PDLMKLADAYGIPGFRISAVEDLEATLEKAAAIVDQPVLVELRVDPDEMVFPMVPAGASNDELLETAEEWHARVAAAAPAPSGPSTSPSAGGDA